MSKAKLTRPCALSIAGLDPSAGAGLLADIKTFEANGVFGLGVCSALTFQNDLEFTGVEWVGIAEILSQLKPLVDRFPVSCVKIGLIENLSVLGAVVSYLKEYIPTVQIVWDPVAKASAGFAFHREFRGPVLRALFGKLSLVTPNRDELSLFEDGLFEGTSCAVLQKSKRKTAQHISDVLCLAGETLEFQSKRIENAEKHGSGCVLSAAICAALARGEPLLSACASGRNYSERFLASSENLIGYHGSHV